MSDRLMSKSSSSQRFSLHGWLGLGLIALFWPLNWFLDGLRTNWGFFPLWLGYSLTVDALVFLRRGTSLLTRNWRKYVGLFIISAPVWWLFEALNERLQNWHYVGSELFSPLAFWIWATLSFSTVIPAVFGTAEFAASFDFLKRLRPGPVIRPTRFVTCSFFIVGLITFILMMIWPKIFFPFLWLSLYFIIEPLNIWLGNSNITRWTQYGNWRPVGALWTGVLLTAFFWEMWNYFSYPKWVYHVPWGGCCHIFEMPLLGYGGYLPFSLELFAVYHIVQGLFGDKNGGYVKLIIEE